MKPTPNRQLENAKGSRDIRSKHFVSEFFHLRGRASGSFQRAVMSMIIAVMVCTTMHESAFAKAAPIRAGQNVTFTNTTESVADGFHIQLYSAFPINDVQTYALGGGVSFPFIKITGQGTTSVSIDYFGAVVSQQQTTHVGVGSADDAALAVNLVDSWWSTGGLRNKPQAWDGTILTTYFNPSDFYTVVRVSTYDNQLNLIGTDWAEGSGEFTDLVNATPDGPVFASYATLFSPTEIPLEDLNSNLTGFGAESQIMEYQATGTPEPGGLALLGTGVAGLAGVLRCRLLG